MPRRIMSAALLGALVLAASSLPGHGLVTRVAAASCSGWTSNTEPPPTIRVFRHVTGAVDTVDFKPYTKNVLSREWISSWTTESLRSGALAVKNYAWYQVLHWRGGTNADGECFDLRDDTWDQVYDPSKPTYPTAAAAVNDTWNVLVHKNGLIFATYYNAGSAGEACGANANGWKAYQWGTQACGLAGLSAAQIILTYYYPNVTVSGGDATPTPTPSVTPSGTPSPTPSPSPSATPAPSGSPTPGASGTPAPSPSPSATPAPTPSTTPLPTATPPPAPSPGQQPGGGQAGVVGAAAPPPPPPPAPAPLVATAELQAAAPETITPSLIALLRQAAGLERMLRLDEDWMGARLTHGMHRVAGMHAAGSPSPGSGGDLRLATFRLLWEQAVRDLLAAVARELTLERTLAWNQHGRRP